MDDPHPPIEVLRAARRWAEEHAHPQPDDRMLAIVYAAGLAAGRTAAAEAMLALADRMERRADGGDNPADCWAMAEFAEELRTLAEGGDRG